MEPFISVVILAYQRRDFLPEAVESVLRQDVDPQDFEVHLVKDFELPEVDDLARSHGWILHRIDLPEVGPKIWAAVKDARGQVVCFLDDDDLWEPGKLTAVLEQFRADERLTYHGTTQSLIDRQGSAMGPSSRGPPEWRQDPAQAIPVRVSLAEPSSSGIARALRANPGNNSSVSVRTTAFRAAQQFVERASFGIDRFLLFLAMTARGALLFDPRPLTRLRVHRAHTSRVARRGYAQYWRDYTTMTSKFFRGASLIREMVSAMGPPEAVPFADLQRREFEVLADLADRSLTRRKAAGFLRRERSADPRLHLTGQLSLAAAVVSPQAARLFNYLSGRKRWAAS